MIGFEWYRSFVAVYQTGTVSAAAQQRRMTQPAISQHVAALEKALKTQLFHRTPRQMVPTEEGKELYTQIVPAVEKLESVSGLSEWRTQAQLPKLRVGAPSEFFYEIGLERLAAAENPGYRVSLSFGKTADLIAQLKADELDIAIATQKDPQRGLHHIPLFSETFAIVAPNSITLPRGLSMAETEAWFAQQAWISYSSELPIIRRFWQSAFGKRPDILPRLIIPDLRTIIRAVELGLGLSVVPLYLCQEPLGRQSLQIPWSAPQNSGNQLYISCQRRRLREPKIEWFVCNFDSKMQANL
jgi:DNA-binding transcriptional LysR family regulator